jgi:nucleotide-binding universal stress UspA family protein
MLPKKIVFGTDFSENSDPARRMAIDYAKAFGAQLIIIHVLDPGWLFADFWGEEINRVVTEAQKLTDARLVAVANECRKEVSDVKTFCKRGSAPREIVSLADEEGADLIVVATHGHAGVRHLVMGSTARSIVALAKCPVLVVPTA